MSNNCFYIDNERYYYDNFHCYMINNRIKAFFHKHSNLRMT